ncbi:MAG: TIGR04372 family glycosyltransferase [Lachnospiraceae bacterium]|nr:TIGR04372 family glycosyltransferase [Lachnospiraceae bacterium]
MKTVIFGSGHEGINYFLDTKDEVVAFLDNAREKQGKYILDVPILPAKAVVDLVYDRIYVAIIDGEQSLAARKQLRAMGISPDVVDYWEQETTDESIIIRTNCYESARAVGQMYCELSYRSQIERFEKQWRSIKKSYKGVRLLRISVCNIGEFIVRYNVILHCEDFHDKDIYTICIPDGKAYAGLRHSVCNHKLLEYVSKDINLIYKKDELLFWSYVISVHAYELILIDYEKYINRGNEPTSYLTNAYKDRILFTAEEKNRWQQKSDKMGITGKYICFAARSSDYHNKEFGTDLTAEGRNMPFSDYDKSIIYLRKQGIQSVRIGRGTPLKNAVDGCVDYAGNYADECYDWYLIANGLFMVSSESGITCMAGFVRRPLLVVNIHYFAIGGSGLEFTEYDLFIPQKVYSRDKHRLLTLSERIALEPNLFFKLNQENLDKYEIEFIPNTQEEILEATSEMLLRIEGKWEESEKDISDRNRFNEILKEESDKLRLNKDIAWAFGPMKYISIASSYLRKNAYLLD